MKHVALVISHFQKKGGLEKHALKISEAFLKKGARLSLLTQKTSFPLIHPQLTTYCLPQKFPFSSFDHNVQKWLKIHEPDVVFGMGQTRLQTHLRAGNGVHAAYLKKYSLSKQLFYRFHRRHRKLLHLEKTAFQHPKLQKIFANSEMVRQEICEHYSVTPSKVEVIHNGVEWDEMEVDFRKWSQAKKEITTRFGIDPSLFHFLFVGNGYQRKGLSPFLHALALLPTRDFFVSIVGKDSKLDSYVHLVKKLQLTNQVRFFGPQIHLTPFYQLADVLVVPSLYDPFANVTVEALAMGLFVLSSTSNGGSEVLTKSTGIKINDVFCREEFTHLLQQVMTHFKTEKSSLDIRNHVRHLNFPAQLNRLMKWCL